MIGNGHPNRALMKAMDDATTNDNETQTALERKRGGEREEERERE